MHRDISSKNILINPNTIEIRLIDFGVAKYNININIENFTPAIGP